MVPMNGEGYDQLQSLSDMMKAHEESDDTDVAGKRIGSYKPDRFDEVSIDDTDEVETPILPHEEPEQASDAEMNKMIADKYKELEDVEGGFGALKYAFRKAVDESTYTPEKNPEMFNSNGTLAGSRGKSGLIIIIITFAILVILGVYMFYSSGTLDKTFYGGDITDTYTEDDSKLDAYIEHKSELDDIANVSKKAAEESNKDE